MGRDARWFLKKHLAGAERMGLFPASASSLCLWGALDLDAHGEKDLERIPEAVATIDFLRRESGLLSYWEQSRGGRGAHVWILFDPPGVPAKNLRLFLEALAGPLRDNGRVDVFPSSEHGRGNTLFLPYFGGIHNMNDSDNRPVSPDKLESNPPAMIPAAANSKPLRATKWPPRYWNLSVPHGANKGGRNRVAGHAAMNIIRRGGTFADFVAWDERENEPPLATDEPQSLLRWWNWAERRIRSTREQVALR
jgi:hypothetical protein